MRSPRLAVLAPAVLLTALSCGTRVHTSPASNTTAPATGVAPSPAMGANATAAPAGTGARPPAAPSGAARQEGSTGGRQPAPSPVQGRTPGAAIGGPTSPAAEGRPANSGGTGAGGSGSRSGGPVAGTPVAPGPAPAAPASVVVIGTVSTLSGPGGTTLVSGVEGVQAWVRQANDRGGVHGHPVRYVVADDGGDPARHRALVQQLVQREGVLAFVQKQEPFAGASIAPYHREIGVPVIGTEGGGDYVYGNPMYFPVAASGDEAAFALLAALGSRVAGAGLYRFGVVYCAEAANCSDYVRVWTSPRGRAAGLDFVYQAKASVAQPDFTAECLGARQAGVDLLAMLMDANSLSRIAASCARQNYHPRFFFALLVTAASVTADQNLAGALVGSQVFAWPAGQTAAQREFLDAMATYRKGAVITGGHALGWVAAKAFERAAAALPEPPTTAAILDGLWSIHDDDLGGLTYPLTFARGQPAGRRACASIVQVGRGRFEAPWGGAVTCFDG